MHGVPPLGLRILCKVCGLGLGFVQGSRPRLRLCAVCAPLGFGQALCRVIGEGGRGWCLLRSNEGGGGGGEVTDLEGW